MSFVTLTCREMVNLLKNLTMEKLVNNIKPYITRLQETMIDGEKITQSSLKCLRIRTSIILTLLGDYLGM